METMTGFGLDADAAFLTGLLAAFFAGVFDVAFAMVGFN
jgi:hypothetical protein